MNGEILQLAMSIGGFALISLWGIQLWEIRQLRSDNKILVLAIGKLTTAVAGLQAELAHKVSDAQCAENRMINENNRSRRQGD